MESGSPLRRSRVGCLPPDGPCIDRVLWRRDRSRCGQFDARPGSASAWSYPRAHSNTLKATHTLWERHSAYQALDLALPHLVRSSPPRCRKRTEPTRQAAPTPQLAVHLHSRDTVFMTAITPLQPASPYVSRAFPPPSTPSHPARTTSRTSSRHQLLYLLHPTSAGTTPGAHSPHNFPLPPRPLRASQRAAAASHRLHFRIVERPHNLAIYCAKLAMKRSGKLDRLRASWGDVVTQRRRQRDADGETAGSPLRRSYLRF